MDVNSMQFTTDNDRRTNQCVYNIVSFSDSEPTQLAEGLKSVVLNKTQSAHVSEHLKKYKRNK